MTLLQGDHSQVTRPLTKIAAGVEGEDAVLSGLPLEVIQRATAEVFQDLDIFVEEQVKDEDFVVIRAQGSVSLVIAETNRCASVLTEEVVVLEDGYWIVEPPLVVLYYDVILAGS